MSGVLTCIHLFLFDAGLYETQGVHWNTRFVCMWVYTRPVCVFVLVAMSTPPGVCVCAMCL